MKAEGGRMNKSTEDSKSMDAIAVVANSGIGAPEVTVLEMAVPRVEISYETG